MPSRQSRLLSRREVLVLSNLALAGCTAKIPTSSSGSNVAGPRLESDWEFEISGRTFRPIVSNDTLYLAGRRNPDSADGPFGFVTAVRTNDGGIRWGQRKLGRSIAHAPLLHGGSIICATTSGEVLSLDAETGDTQWEKNVERGVSNRPVVIDDTVFVGDRAGTVIGLRASDGTQQWRHEIDEKISGLGATGAVLYVAANGLHSFDASGSKRWSVAHDIESTTAPRVESETVFVGGEDGLYAFEKGDGNERWRSPVGRVSKRPTTVEDGMYAAAGEGLVALSRSDGSVRWKALTDARPAGTPAVTDEFVFIGAKDEFFGVRRSDGDVGMQTQFVDGFENTSPTSAGRAVYVGNFERVDSGYNGRVFSFSVE